jgi:hypothetical protein
MNFLSQLDLPKIASISQIIIAVRMARISGIDPLSNDVYQENR